MCSPATGVSSVLMNGNTCVELPLVLLDVQRMGQSMGGLGGFAPCMPKHQDSQPLDRSIYILKDLFCGKWEVFIFLRHPTVNLLNVKFYLKCMVGIQKLVLSHTPV